MNLPASNVTRFEVVALLLILVGALALRLPAMKWGLPPTIPQVIASGIRSSYSFDEDDVLTGASHTRPWKLDFDVREYHWGALHLEMTALWLEMAEVAGVFGGPWRQAYYQMVPGLFERVYATARALSVFLGLVSIVLVYIVGREVESAAAGLWAAAVVAASPVHLLASTQVRMDLTMMAMLILTVWLGVRAQKQWQPWLLIALGIAGGLAITAKYPAAFVVLPLLVIVAADGRFPFRSAALMTLGTIAGCWMGQPYVLTRFSEMVSQIRPYVIAQTPAPFKLSLMGLLRLTFLNVARFLVGPVALGAALAGICRSAWRHRQGDWLILSGLAGTVLSLIPLRWALLRYLIPLLPFLAIAAGIAIASLTRWPQWVVGCTALVFPVCASLAQLHYMISPHPANQILPVILNSVTPGTPVSRLLVGLPPLDTRVYPMGPSLFFSDLTKELPPWVLMADLPDQEYPLTTRVALKDRYDEIAEARSGRILAWATLGESGAPHDWKYTHPWMTLYRRRW
ncbi:MAG TPA: glycosyltransferase family 39 protein [Terriglobia bacterium]|nr:glycosyltransferase family 39 protein [Terriglobia bacterium]